jgi:uncharacterized membrane protein
MTAASGGDVTIQGVDHGPRVIPQWAEEEAMSGLRIAGIALIILGIVGLVYGQFSYTKKSHDADLGVLKLSIKEKETVNVPVWAGVGGIAAGAALLLVGRKR